MPVRSALPFPMGIASVASALLCGALLLPAMAGAQATQYKDAPPLLVGAAWYPEQWDEATADHDLDTMKAAHVHLARVAEFAWSAMEPEEGHYDWGWLDHAIAEAAKHHIYIVLGTPTAAPPAWLTTKYPETLRVDDSGRRDEHGNRAQFSFASTKYRELAHGIAEAMAKRYGHNPNVVGWQLDNEYGEDSFDPDARAQWHAWLKKKYGTIDRLNTLWTTQYWSQTYDNFDEIPAHEKDENPALLLDWKHFVSDTWKSYSENQISAIRPNADPRQFITTNTMGWFDGFDSYVVHSVLDIAAWDAYVGGDNGGDNYDWANMGAAHDLTRGYKQKNFWVMETEPAFVNWRKTNTPLIKGQVRDMAWQAVGHGADAVEYWQWRSALNGQEQYHGTLVGPDGKPVPVYAEVQQVGAEFEKAGKALSGTTPVANVAMLHDFDSRWAIDFQRHAAKFDPVAELVSFYRPLQEDAQGVDVIAPTAELDKYKLVVAPAINVLPQATADHLIAYVKQGGHLVLGPRSGMKNEYDGLWPNRQPGPLEELLGGRVEEFYALEQPVTTTPVVNGGAEGKGEVWAELLEPTDHATAVVAKYKTSPGSAGWLDDQPAILTRQVGKGRITYVGFWPDAPTLSALMAAWVKDADVAPLVPNVPEGVEVCERAGDGRRVLVLINHSTEAKQVALPAAMTDLLKGGSTSNVELEKYGVAVLEATR
ncbi:MAG: beta-galactosidase [Acidobacteriaceae bacterium]